MPTDSRHAPDDPRPRHRSVSLAADLWPPEAIEAIRAASLELLARVGVRVDSPEAAALLEAAGGHPARRAGCCCRRPPSAAALESCRGEYVMLARDPERDLAIGPGRGASTSTTWARRRPSATRAPGASRPATFRDQVLAARVMHHQRYPDSINSLVTPGDVPAELHPLYSYFAIAAETDKPIGGPGQDHAWQTPVLFEMATAVLAARPGGAPAGGIVLEMGYSPVSPLHLGAGVCDGIVAAARLGMAVQVLTNPGRRHHGAGVTGRRARPAGRRDPRRRGAGAGGGARHGLRLRRAALRGRSARRPAALRRRPVVARLGRRDAAGAAPRPRLRLLRAGHLGAARRRAGRVPAGAAGARRRARTPVHDVRHRRLGRRRHVPRTAGRRRRHLPRRARRARAARLGRRRPRRRRDDRGRHRSQRLPRHASHTSLAARQPRLRGRQLARRSEEWIAAGSPDALELARERVRQALAHEPVGLPETWRPSSAASSTRRRPGSASPGTRTRAGCWTRRASSDSSPDRSSRTHPRELVERCSRRYPSAAAVLSRTLLRNSGNSAAPARHATEMTANAARPPSASSAHPPNSGPSA